MDIIAYLLDLLQQSKEVGITGLGTFYKKKSPGKYDKESQAFLPPSYTVHFTTKVKSEDKFVNHIAEKRNISVESAQYYIDQFVEETNKHLELEHEAELPEIGRLFFTEHEGLSFEPAKNVNFGSEFFGLPQLPETKNVFHQELSLKNDEEPVYEEIDEAPSIIPPATQEQAEPVIENIELDEVKDDLKNTLQHAKIEDETIIQAPAFIKEQHGDQPDRFGHQPENEQKESNTYINLDDAETAKLPIVEAPEFIKEQHEAHPNRFGHDPLLDPIEEDEQKSIWPKILIGLLVIAVIGAIVYFIKPELFSAQVKEQPKQVVPIDTVKPKVDSVKLIQDSIRKTDSVLKANQVQSAADTVKRNLPPVAKTPEITFHVIGTSYATTKAAEIYIQNVKKIGINAHIAKMPGRRKNISIGSYKTQKEAEENLIILQKKLKGSGFYIQQIINTQP